MVSLLMRAVAGWWSRLRGRLCAEPSSSAWTPLDDPVPEGSVRAKLSDGGYLIGPDGTDSVRVYLMPGEQVFDKNGRRVF